MLQPLLKIVYDVSKVFHTGDETASERSNPSLCQSTLQFRHVKVFFCCCFNNGVQNCNDFINLVQAMFNWPYQTFVRNLKSADGNGSSDGNEDKKDAT